MSTEADFWDSIAEKYAAAPVADRPAFERKKALTRELLPPGARVLEIGCSTGSLALAMSPYAGRIDALDVSAEMLRIARAKQRAAGVGNVTFHEGAIESVSFAPESFDSAWAYSILHLVPDRGRTLETLFALLRPGGSLVSSNLCLGDARVPYGPFLRVLRWLGKAPTVRIYDRATLRAELHSAGFVDVVEHDVGARDANVAFVVARKPGREPSG